MLDKACRVTMMSGQGEPVWSLPEKQPDGFWKPGDWRELPLELEESWPELYGLDIKQGRAVLPGGKAYRVQLGCLVDLYTNELLPDGFFAARSFRRMRLVEPIEAFNSAAS